MTIILVIGLIAFITNWIASRLDKAAHARIEKFPDTTNVDDCMKHL